MSTRYLNVSFSSSHTPRYLYSVTRSIHEPLKVDRRRLSVEAFLALENSIHLVLPALRTSFKLIRAFCKTLKESCKFSIASCVESAIQYRTVSSAYKWAWQSCREEIMSLIKIVKRAGPKTEPCGTPLATDKKCNWHLRSHGQLQLDVVAEH